MELKNWLRQNLNKVHMLEEFGVSKAVYDFIIAPEEDKTQLL
jgi:hypothetical protein